jgi:uncharacterized damage-inducible protein DinB
MMLVTAAMLITALSTTQAAPPEFKPSTNPVSDHLRELVVRGAKNLIGAAERMPAEKYTYHPTPAQMTFGGLVVHIVQTNSFLCSGIGNTPLSPTADELKKLAETDSKDSLVSALKQSFDYCTAALSKVTDAQLGEEVTILGRRTGQSRAAAMITIANDWADHYSTAAGYLRLNDILPPTAQPKK